MTTIILDPRPDPAKQQVQWLTIVHSCGCTRGHKIHPQASDAYKDEIAASLAVRACQSCQRAQASNAKGKGSQ